MVPFRPGLCASTALAATLVVLAPLPLHADGPKVLEFSTQQVGQTTYFLVRVETPKNYRAPDLSNRSGWWWTNNRTELPRLPRLVPQDGCKAVYLRPNFINLDQKGNPRQDLVDADLRLERLEFLGKREGKGSAKLLLLYPTNADTAPGEGKKKQSAMARLLREQGSWGEVAVTLDFAKAKKVAIPERLNRQAQDWPMAADLEGQWAAAQAGHFAVLEALTPDFGFYGLARQSTGRKYSVPAPALPSTADWANRNDPQFFSRRLYEVTTGADAIAESMALRRMRDRNFRDNGDRSVDVTKVAGIDIAEHPWEKMMAGQKPSAEPLAKLVPHDNYYLHFKSIVKFLDIGDLMDQWGTTMSRAYEVSSRDNMLKQRLEQQLCLKSTGVARLFGPAVIKGLAVTGSDPYVREGSDVTVIFNVSNKPLFLSATDAFIQEARKKFGAQLREGKEEHEKATVESYVTPQREVSLYRVVVDDYILYSNSPIGVRRVLDTYRGKRKALSDSLDYQYMRTVFRLEDPQEDGFVFLSDAFLRNLVGPALRIKERRRLEAVTSLYMVTHGAMFAAWENGRLPENHDALLAFSRLKADELFCPEGAGAYWDGERKQAISPVYNTLQFATPLIELPIDRITQNEEREYQQFRGQYLGLWRQFFDPVGIRVAVNDKQARVETYILPLVQNTQYNELRARTGDGTTTVGPAGFGSKTLTQFKIHISPKAPERQQLRHLINSFGRQVPGTDWLGNWLVVRLDDSDVYAKLAELSVRRELDRNGRNNWQEEAKLFFQVPLTVGVEIKNKLVFAAILAAARTQVMTASPDTVDWGPMKPAYKGVTIVRIQAKGDAVRDLTGGDEKDKFEPSLYYASIDNGWYLSLSEASLKDLIDRRADAKAGKVTTEAVKVNSSLYVSPAAAEKAKDFLRFYLEWETHKRTLTNTAVLYPLYRCGLVAADASPAEVRAAAMHYLGFVPVSADEAPFTYSVKTGEVVNSRHGSLRQPLLNSGVEASSPLGRLLEQFRSVRADLRFREDGINTVLTFDRRGQ